jgi:enoyl-CoA hydratase
MTRTDDHVLARQHHGMGHITLNRPEHLNALTRSMVTLMRLSLAGWRHDHAVRTVVIDGTGHRGLSAGDDLRALYADVRAGGGRAMGFWAEACRLAAEMASYPKPIVALMDGVVVGSAAAIAGHASHRVVREDSIVALPEVAIAMVPHIGGTRLLAQMPGEVGTHLALTGDRMDAADAIYCGFADQWVPADARTALFDALSDAPADEALARVTVDVPEESELRTQRGWIDHCYAFDRIEDIVDRLRTLRERDAAAAGTRIAALPPTALKVALRALREGRADPDIESSLRREFRIAARAIVGHDVPTAMRAQLFDRGGPGRWQPATAEEVTEAEVNAYFEAPEQGDVDLHQVPDRGNLAEGRAWAGSAEDATSAW